MSEKFRALYERQLAILAEKDHLRLIDENYTADAQLLNYTTHVVGADALKDYFKGYIEHLGYLKLLSTDKYAEGNDSLMFEAHVETAGGVAHVYDVFIIRDGRISHHFAGLLGFIPNSQS
ncbi:MAG: nuclear transport factor 2 family protein [Anaerolineae bacterium]|nr:nuclear transport factor 2 family protein [Anaerolineae bacterium]NUQ04284.1 nuclear transport factor 2 family protein [Anaerolineae bacterium]